MTCLEYALKNSVEEAVLLCLHTISLWVFAKPYFICANFFSRKDIFFSLYMHRKREGNFSKPAVFLETLAVLTFFFFFSHFCFFLLSGLTVKMEAAVHGLMPVVLQQGERMKVRAVGWPSLCGSS